MRGSHSARYRAGIFGIDWSGKVGTRVGSRLSLPGRRKINRAEEWLREVDMTGMPHLLLLRRQELSRAEE